VSVALAQRALADQEKRQQHEICTAHDAIVGTEGHKTVKAEAQLTSASRGLLSRVGADLCQQLVSLEAWRELEYDNRQTNPEPAARAVSPRPPFGYGWLTRVSLFAGISIVQRTPSARNLRSTLPPNSWARRSRITLLP